MEVERDEAQRAEIAAAERARLARAVHDGVLQVLALVQRRGRELGGEAAELGRLAGEQESALRALIRQQDSLAGPATDELADLASALSRLERTAPVTVAGPGRAGAAARRRGRPSWSPSSAPASTTSPATSARTRRRGCCSRRSRTGSSCRSATRGRASRPAGSSRPRTRGGSASPQSIRGRVADLGGTVELVTGSFGTEWEVTVPRRTLAPVTIHSEHPFLEPESDRDPVRRLRGRLGGAVTLWTVGRRGRPGRADRVLADGRRRRAGAGAGPGRPRLRPARPAPRRPVGPSCSCSAGRTATSPTPSPVRRPPRRAVPDGGVRADRVGPAAGRGDDLGRRCRWRASPRLAGRPWSPAPSTR